MNELIKLNFLDIERLKKSVVWEPHKKNNRKGAEASKLYSIKDKVIALVKFHPGSNAIKHIHNNFEAIYVIDGGYSDEYGTYKQGDLLIYPDQSSHSWSSENGALLYVVWGGNTTIEN